MGILSSSARLRAVALAGAIGAIAAAQGCSASDKLLSATDPDLVFEGDLNTPEAADALRLGAFERWKLTTGGDNTNGNDNTWLFGGLLADEWGTASTFVQNDEADQRRIKLDNSTVTFAYRKLNRVRTAVNQALPLMRKFRATQNVQIAELYLARAFSELQLASDFCNGLALSDAKDALDVTTISYGGQITVDSVFRIAVNSADSGLTAVGTTTGSEATLIRNALAVTKARALLGLGRFAEAGTAITLSPAIPTSFAYQHTYRASSGSNAIWGQPRSGRRYNVGDSVEGNSREIRVFNAIPFFSSRDPRVPSSYTISSNLKDTTKSQDGQTFSRTTTLWGQEDPVDVANGTDARLIEAEVAFRAGDVARMMTILNALRASPPRVGGAVTPTALPALATPATPEAQLDLLFREKAFWTFGRGQRLGDMRRLVRQYSGAPYNRTVANTFPVGEHYRGGQYGPDVNLPVPQQEQNNPNVGAGAATCTDRNP